MPGEHPAPPEDVAAVGRRMLVDRSTVEVATALRGAGVEPVLLKGPVVARWLYDGASERTYHDADLLVAPADQATAERVLADLGYVRVGEPEPQVPVGAAGPHADTWVPRTGGVAVDLHRCLHHTEHLPPQQVWDEVWRDHAELEVCGVVLSVPAVRVRALHAVLHLQPKDQPGSQAWNDLERAILRVDRATWSQAAELAGRFGVADDMGALLALLPDGAELAQQLDLTTAPRPVLLQHHRRHADPVTRFRRRLRGAGAAGSVRVVAAKLGPTRIRRVAGPGDVSLARAYAQQARRIVAGFGAWRRASAAGEVRRLR